MLRDKLNLALIAGIAIAICGIVIYSLSPAVKAQPTSTAIEIVAKTTDTPVATITFPAGQPNAIISAPYNSVDLIGDPQVLHATTSEPVVRLLNTSGGTLRVWLQITDWTGGANRPVVSERYELVAIDDRTVAVVDNVLSGDGSAASVATGVSIPAGEYKALYLEVVLGAGYGKSGTSTLTILGET